MNNPASRSDTFLQRKGFQLATQHCLTGEGACTPIADIKKGKDPENRKKTLVFQLLLALIVAFRQPFVLLCKFSGFSYVCFISNSFKLLFVHL